MASPLGRMMRRGQVRPASARIAPMLLMAALGAILAAAGGEEQDRRAQLSWWDRAPEQQVGHYIIKTDMPPDHARHLARYLNIMYDAYAQRLRSLRVRVEERLHVYAFQSRQEYNITLRARFGVNPTGSGGMFFVTSTGTGLAFWMEGLPFSRIEHVIQHEGFHQFAYSRFGDDLPVWVNEGLAEFFGEGVVIDDQLVLGQSTPRVIDAVKNAIEMNQAIPFHTMLSMTNQQWRLALQNDTAALQYHQAWSMVHFLIHGDGGRYVEPFEKYLHNLANGLPSGEAFKRSFGDDIEAFEQRWKAYALAARPSAFVTALERLEFLAHGALELARQGRRPASLAELKAALQEINFSHVINTHGVETTLSSADDAMFEIPVDELCQAQPEFLVEPARLRGMSVRERRAEDVNPTPPVISTKNLRPRGLTVTWIRREGGNDFRFELEMQ